MLLQVMERVSFDRNIVQYYGAWLEQDDAPFLVMEYMEVLLGTHTDTKRSEAVVTACRGAAVPGSFTARVHAGRHCLFKLP